MKAYWRLQYEMIKGSRAVLLDYCETVSPLDFITEVPGFGRGGSMRNLLVHIVTTYQWWLEKQALGKEVVFPEYTDIATVGGCRLLFEKVNAFMDEFIERFGVRGLEEMHLKINGTGVVATPMELFVHVVTHEFHHKGQVLSISRHLGYVPVDTDVMR